jgi:hypothetical protein
MKIKAMADILDAQHRPTGAGGCCVASIVSVRRAARPGRELVVLDRSLQRHRLGGRRTSGGGVRSAAAYLCHRRDGDVGRNQEGFGGSAGAVAEVHGSPFLVDKADLGAPTAAL